MNARRLIAQSWYVYLIGAALAWDPPPVMAQEPVLSGHDANGIPGRPRTQSVDSSPDPAKWDPWTTGMQPPREMPPIDPAAVKRMLGLALADGIEEGSKGGKIAREGLFQSDGFKGNYRSRKWTKGLAEGAAAAGKKAAIPDKGGDAASWIGALSSAISFDEHGRPSFNPEHVDVPGAVGEATKNALSNYATYYGAQSGAAAGAKLGALTGTPLGIVAGALVGGVVGSMAGSIAFDIAGGRLVDHIADAASARRGIDNLEAVLARCRFQLQDARMQLKNTKFDDALRQAKQVQDSMSSFESEMTDSGLGHEARQLKFAALAIQGDIARLRLAASANASRHKPPVPELPAAPPHATRQIMFKGRVPLLIAHPTGEWHCPLVCEISGMIDVANQKVYGEANWWYLPNRHGGTCGGSTIHFEFHGNYEGDNESGIFEATGIPISRDPETGKTTSLKMATIRGKLDNGRVTGSYGGRFDFPAQ